MKTIGALAIALLLSTPAFAQSFQVQGTFNVIVTPINHPPVANDDSGTTPEGTSFILDLLANDTDPDGDTLTIVKINGQDVTVGSIVTLPSGATVELNADQTVTYTPPVGFSGTDSGTYTISD